MADAKKTKTTKETDQDEVTEVPGPDELNEATKQAELAQDRIERRNRLGHDAQLEDALTEE